MGVNKALLRKVRDHILAEPRRYTQMDVVDKTDRSPCGTAACIFGWGAVLSGLMTVEELHATAELDGDFPFDQVGEQFGFTKREIDVVCDCDGDEWPKKFGNRLRAAQHDDDKEEEAKAGADYINYIIRTGKVT